MKYVNSSAGLVAEVPLGVTTVTFTLPLVGPGGLAAVISLSESTVILGDFALPKSASVAPVKPLPVMVTAVPPIKTPADGETAVTCGSAVDDVAGGGEDEAGGGDDEAVLAWPHAPPTVARTTVPAAVIITDTGR
jgi:hypothetical protein